VRPASQRLLHTFPRQDDAAVIAACRDALTTDPTLARALAGLLWARYAHVVEGIATHRFREDPDEVVGDVMVRFTRCVYGSTHVESLPALLRVMTARAVTDALRRRARTGALPAGGVEAGPADPLAGIEAAEVEVLLDRHLNARDADLIRSLLAGEPAASVGERLGLRPATVDVARFRARERLRRALQGGAP
jgi:DNA-directed RNA polymerase specialized sigma24 family protein